MANVTILYRQVRNVSGGWVTDFARGLKGKGAGARLFHASRGYGAPLGGYRANGRHLLFLLI